MATNKTKAKNIQMSVCGKCSNELPAQSFKTKSKKNSEFCSHCRNLNRVGKKVYNNFVKQQRKTCAVCHAECEDLRIDLNADGEVRGLLCIDCEVALVEMKQSPITVASALHYLEKDLTTRPVRTVQIVVAPGNNDVFMAYDHFSYWELNAVLYRAIEQVEEQMLFEHQKAHDEEDEEE